MLTEDKRTQLDGIVQKMVQNRESDDTISFVVNDFKNKYAVQEPEKTFSEKTAGVLDLLFGGGKVGEAIGTGIAKGKFGKTIQKAVVGKELTPQEESFVSPAPSAGEIAGSALQSAALFTPLGTLGKGITTGARALGMVKGASALGKIGAGALSGEVFDIASNLQQGKVGKDALTPGLGTILGGGIPAVGVAKNVLVRFGSDQAPRVINSLVKPLAKDFSYGKNPGRAIAEEGIIANNFDDLISSIRTSRQRIGQEIGDLSNTLSERPLLNIRNSLSPLDDAAKVAASQNNPTLLGRLNNVKRAITEVLEPHLDDTGNLAIKSIGSRDLENLTFKQARNILGDVGDLTAFTGNPSDDKLVNSALKQVYGKIKGESLKAAREINPSLATQFEKLTEKYADLHSAEIAAKYRDKIVERQSLVGLNPLTAGIGTGLITAVATGGATIPIAVAGISGALIDKLASTPGFKTRLAYLLSTKTQQEANYLFRKIPALSKFFSLKAGATPGDVLLGKTKEELQNLKSIPNKQGGFISTGYKETGDLTTKILKDLEGKTTVSKQYILDATNRGELKQVERDLIRDILERETGGKTYYHVTSADNVGSIKEKGFLPQIGDRSRGAANAKGTWLYESKNPTTEFGKNFKNPTVVEAKVNGEIFDAMSDDRSIRALVEDKKLIAKLKSEGYVGIKGDELGTEATFIFEPKALKPSSDTINVSDFAKKVKAELLPLKANTPKAFFGKSQGIKESFKYEGITLPDEIRGKVANYKENIYQSPIQTSAGQVHFGSGDSAKNYFGHTRIEDMADNKTRRVIEVQSDLYQKGNLEREVGTGYDFEYLTELEAKKKAGQMYSKSDLANLQAVKKEFEKNPSKNPLKLKQYNDPTAHFRMVREEIKKAAQDGKTKLQFPTGETAMKIEGLAETDIWKAPRLSESSPVGRSLISSDLKVGKEISRNGNDNLWIVTDVLENGKFKAVPKPDIERFAMEASNDYDLYQLAKSKGLLDDGTLDAQKAFKNKAYMDAYDKKYRLAEEFDISGKVDTNNPIYKFYEKDVAKYLNKFGGKRVVDDKGVSWIEIPITKEQGKAPVEAFGKIGLSPLTIGAGTTALGALGAKMYADNKKK